jgi:hypothetical protein
MDRIKNWRGEDVASARSGGGVLVLADPLENLVRGKVAPWPPPEILQKLYQSRQVRAFHGDDLRVATETLGYYTDLQSVHSEDAITWSVFGTLAYSGPAVRARFCSSLLRLLRLSSARVSQADVWLWRRVPHPDTLVMGGPEIDFGVHAGHTLLLGEAKWLSGVGRGQGKARDKDQLALRREFIEKYGRLLCPGVSRFAVVSVSLSGGLSRESDASLGTAQLHMRDVTWDAVCALDTHPHSRELRDYLAWKVRNSRAV